MSGPMTRRPGADPWENLKTVAARCLQELLARPWFRDRGVLTRMDLEAAAQQVQDLVAPRAMSRLLRVGRAAWIALADDLERDDLPWRTVARRWASPSLPASFQCHLWAEYVPYADGAGLRLRKALQRRRGRGDAPRSFENRIILRISRTAQGWLVGSCELERIQPGDETAIRVKVKHDHGEETLRT
jgi:hypothetical protein